MLNKVPMLFAISLFSTGVYAQAQAEKPVKADETSVAAEPQATVEREITEEDESDLDTFNPSEKINVDSSVSFPVDI